MKLSRKIVLLIVLSCATSGCLSQRAWMWEQIGRGADEQAYEEALLEIKNDN